MKNMKYNGTITIQIQISVLNAGLYPIKCITKLYIWDFASTLNVKGSSIDLMNPGSSFHFFLAE